MSLMPRCSSPHLCTPTHRTEGGSGVGVAMGEIAAAPVPGRVVEDACVSSARNPSDQNATAKAEKLIRTSKRKLGHCCFIKALDRLSPITSVSRTLLKVPNEQKPLSLAKMTDSSFPSTIS